MEREHVAYHEAGHAVICYVLGLGQVGKVSIEPKGELAGHVSFPQGITATLDDPLSQVKLVANLLAGHAAVEILTGEESSKMYPERVQAAAMIYWSVTGLNVQEQFLSLTDDDDLSELTWVLEEYAETIVVIDEGVRKRLRANWTAVEAVADTLLEQGTMSSDEVEAILRDKVEERDV